jgi:hypothetical protein
VEFREILPGVLRWELPHPEWTPEEEADDGWGEVVASYALRDEAGLVLFDPLVTGDWAPLDAEVERAGGPPRVELTIFWHVRSTPAVLDRYDGTEVWAHEPALEQMHERTRVTDPFTADDLLPGGVRAFPSRRRAAGVRWLPERRALLAGDVLLGANGGGVRLCPPSWLGTGTYPEQIRAAVAALLDLPFENILLTHGEPVIGDGHAALEEALAR